MMFKKYIPESLLQYRKLIKLRKKFLGRIINSHMVGFKVELGNDVALSRDTDIRDGVTIDDYSYVSPGTIIMSGKIGKFTSIGYNCQIGMSEHPTNYMSTSPFIYSERNIFGYEKLYNEFQNPPIIGNDVWIGSNAIILQGVKIDDGAIIAAGAVVTKNVEPFTIVGGVPAKLIKKRFDEERIKFLLELKWWDMPIDKLQNYKDIFAKKENWF